MSGGSATSGGAKGPEDYDAAFECSELLALIDDIDAVHDSERYIEVMRWKDSSGDSDEIATALVRRLAREKLDLFPIEEVGMEVLRRIDMRGPTDDPTLLRRQAEAERVLRVISGWNPERVSTAEAIQPDHAHRRMTRTNEQKLADALGQVREIGRFRDSDDREPIVVYTSHSDTGLRYIIAQENEESLVLTSNELRWLVNVMFGGADEPIPAWRFWLGNLRWRIGRWL